MSATCGAGADTGPGFQLRLGVVSIGGQCAADVSHAPDLSTKTCKPSAKSQCGNCVRSDSGMSQQGELDPSTYSARLGGRQHLDPDVQTQRFEPHSYLTVADRITNGKLRIAAVELALALKRLGPKLLSHSVQWQYLQHLQHRHRSFKGLRFRTQWCITRIVHALYIHGIGVAGTAGTAQY